MSMQESGFEAHLSATKDVPVDQVVRKLDYKTKIAMDELFSLSSFMKRCLIYLAVMASLSVYLHLARRKYEG